MSAKKLMADTAAVLIKRHGWTESNALFTVNHMAPLFQSGGRFDGVPAKDAATEIAGPHGMSLLTLLPRSNKPSIIDEALPEVPVRVTPRKAPRRRR